MRSFETLISASSSCTLAACELLRLAKPASEFALEASPESLAVLPVLVLQKPEGFCGTQLSDSGEVFHSTPIRNLGAGEFALGQHRGHSIVPERDSGTSAKLLIHGLNRADGRNDNLWHKYSACPDC
jgi:hypothetical protein